MNDQSKRFAELAKKGALSNDLLTAWLLDLEERVRRLESLWSHSVAWEVGKAELAETKKER